MEPSSNTQSRWRILRRLLISTAVLSTLVALFYTEEDWRGKRAWENCKRDLESKGIILDWNAYIPPPVPDDQNFFAAPKMQDLFARDNYAGTSYGILLTNSPIIDATITDKKAAADFLAWSDRYQSDFDLMREALKRPYTRIDGDYSLPYKIPIANFINIRIVAQVLCQRTKCYLLIGQPDKALEQLTLLDDSRRIMERQPTGKPMTLVDAMINVAVTAVYVDTIAYGFRHHVWLEPQLKALQNQLNAIDLPPLVVGGFKFEEVSLCYRANTLSFSEIMDAAMIGFPTRYTFWQRIERFGYRLIDLAPRGWRYQNLVVALDLNQKSLDGLDLQDETVSPHKLNSSAREISQALNHHSLFNIWANIAIPNYNRAIQRLAYVQTEVNEGQIACALERYHQAYGIYPSSLDALTPHYLGAIPHDIIDGGPLIYRPTLDGKFLLYSIGWSEKDNDGKGGLTNYPPQGDWVWEN